MRDKKRIKEFCNDLADIWENNCPNWRFGQLMSNVLVTMATEGRNPFFSEEDEMIKYFRNYFKNENED